MARRKNDVELPKQFVRRGKAGYAYERDDDGEKAVKSAPADKAIKSAPNKSAKEPVEDQ